jgi:hypothetical protein
MTTITIQNPSVLSRYSFQSEDDLLMYLIKRNKIDRGIYELDDEDVSNELLQKIAISKQKPLSEFTSISS